MSKKIILFCSILCISYLNLKAQQKDLYAQEALQEVINGVKHETEYIAMKSTLHYFHPSLYNQKRNGYNTEGQKYFNYLRTHVKNLPQKVDNLTANKSEKFVVKGFPDYKGETITPKGMLYTYTLAQNNGKNTIIKIFFDDEMPTQAKILEVVF